MLNINLMDITYKVVNVIPVTCNKILFVHGNNVTHFQALR